MKDIPLAFKIIGLVVIFLGAFITYFLITAPKAPPDNPVAFVDPFPPPLPPRPEVVQPTVLLSADSTIVPYNGEAVLSWSAFNSDSCIASDSWAGKQAISGTFSTGPLTEARTYDIKCVGKNGESTVQSVTVNVIPLPVGILNASPNPVPYNGNTMLTWSASEDAEDCVASGAWSGNKRFSGNQKEVGLTSTRTYILKCTGRGGTSISSVTVNVIPLPTGEFTVNPNPVPYKESAILSWSASDASSCEASGSWSGKKAITGTESTGPLASSKTYSLRCVGRGGVTSKSVTVRVLSLPKGTLVAEPASVPYGGSATITWSATGNATSCIASGGWEGNKAPEGTESTGPLIKTQKYTLVCKGTGGTSAPRSITIAVGAQPKPGTGPTAKPTGELTAHPTTVPYGTSPTLTWSSLGADSCTASGGWKGVKEVSGSEAPGPITRTTTYALRCGGRGGATSNSVTVTVIPLPSAGTLRVNPNPVPYGESTNITWSSSKDATSCTASGGGSDIKGWSGTKETSGTEIVGPFTSTQTLTLTCSSAGGESKPQSVVVKVLPRGDFYAVEPEIVSGTRPTLKWNIENATQCTASGGWSGARPASGTESVDLITRPTSSKTYSLSCTGPGGTKTSSVTVRLIQLPTGTFTASPTTVDYKGVTTLSWSPSPDTTSCRASGGWEGVKSSSSGTESVGPLTSTRVYTLTCEGPGGAIEKSVTVKVKPLVDLFAVVPPAVPGTSVGQYIIGLNQAPKLNWSLDNADSCTPSGWNDGRDLSKDEFITKEKIMSAIVVNTTYSITCKNPAGSVTKTITLKIKDPTVSLSADATSVPYGGNTTLRWSATDANSCSASSGWSGAKAVSGGNYETGSLTVNHTYRLSCVGPHRTTSATVTVEARPLRTHTTYFRCSVPEGSDLASYYQTSKCTWAGSAYPEWPRFGKLGPICDHPGNPSIPSINTMGSILQKLGLSAPNINRIELTSSTNVSYCGEGAPDGIQGIFRVYYP